MQIRPFDPSDTEPLIRLWGRCNLLVPWNNPYLDIQRKRDVDPALLLVGVVEGEVVASVMGGYEGHRGWINYLAVAPTHRRRGYGAAMVAAIESELHARGCPKINLQVRASNAEVIHFYERLGYTVENVISLGKRLHEEPPYHLGE